MSDVGVTAGPTSTARSDCTSQTVVRRAVLGDQGAAPVAVPYALTCIVAPEHDRLGLHGGSGKRDA